jgi:hypothetical protein
MYSWAHPETAQFGVWFSGSDELPMDGAVLLNYVGPKKKPKKGAHQIYVASSWRNDYQPTVVEVLRKAGHQVYDFRHPDADDHGFHWSDIDPDWQNWDAATYREKLNHPLAESGFAKDKAGMDEAKICILVQPCGASAHTEAAYMAGQGKVVIALLHSGEPELMYKLFTHLCVSLDELVSLLGALPAG